jgi:hypothetical protein
MENREFAKQYLLAVEKENQKFFTDNHISIMNCVNIVGNGKLISVHITNEKIPEKIRYEIESMFWIN